MEKEMSSSATIGLILIVLATTIGLGLGVFSSANSVSNVDGVVTQIEVMNSTILTITAILAWLNLIIGPRLSYLNYNYYSNRFKILGSKTTNIEVKHISNIKLNLFQMIVLLFKPVKFKKVVVFNIDNYSEVEVKGKLEVVDNRLYIDGFYLSLNTDLFEYLDKEVNIKIKSAGNKERIERNLVNYEVLKVETV